MSLREQFEAWMEATPAYKDGMRIAAFTKQLMFEAFQAGHAVNADLIQALHECIGWFEDNQVDCIALDEAREAMKKARAE